MRGAHDLGGLPGGPIDRSEHELSLFEQRVDALLMLLVHPERGAFKIDALRRAIEEYNKQDYDSLTYYQRWLGAIRKLVVEQDILTEEEIEAKVTELRAQEWLGDDRR